MGQGTPFETVLAADTERAALIAEEDAGASPERVADIHERLIAIDAHTAPARAARAAPPLLPPARPPPEGWRKDCRRRR